MNIKKRFEKLSQREIIQLYLIVIMIYGLIFIFYKDLSFTIYPIKTYAASLTKISKNDQPHTKKLSDLNLLTYFNDNARDAKIEIKDTKISTNSIELKMIGAFRNIMIILNQISHNFNIKQFEMQKMDNTIDLSIQLERETFHIVQHSEFRNENIFNPFILKRANTKYKASTIVVSAIVDLEVFVNNTWYKKGDRIKEYLILLIQKNEVLFLNTKTKKKIIKSIIYE